MSHLVRSLVPWWALALLGCASDPPLEVARVDLAAFQGPWYEIAKLPRATEASCTGTTASYRLKSDTELDVVNECHDDPDVPGKLSLDFGGFYGDYWIIEVDPDYRRAAVGHPSRDYLWILDRLPSMPEEELAAITERMRQKGFDVSRLERTLQNADGEPSAPKASSLPSTSDHGCSMASVGPRPHRTSRPSRTAGWLAVFGLAVAVGWASRRRTRASTN
jgi:apolipoprotein D and lipocalin family protein